MKKTLLFSAILALSLNVYSQTKSGSYNDQHSKTTTIQTAKARLDAATLNTKSTSFKSNSQQSRKHKTLQKLSSGDLIQLVDSVYQWHWNTSSLEWDVDYKFKYFIYDANYNLTGYTELQWNGNTWVNSSKNTAVYNSDNNFLSQLNQNWIDSEWIANSLSTYSYESNGNFTSFMEQSWNGSGWDNTTQFTWTYDLNNNMETEITLQGDGAIWKNQYKILWTYDANNKKTTEILQKWLTSNIWANSTKYSYSYDDNNNKLSETFQIWDGSASWTNKRHDVYTYDINNNLVSLLLQKWDETVWAGYMKYDYTYDANSYLISKIDQQWNGSSWDSVFQNSHSYDASNNLILESYQQWDGTDWKAFYQYVYTYDAGNNQTSKLHQHYDGSAWQNDFKNNSSFDANGMAHSDANFEWDYTSGDIVSGDSTYYYFHTLVTGITGLDKSNISVYPNPAKGKFTITSNNPISAVEIYNVSGKRVFGDFNLKQQVSKDIDLTGYAKGIYILKIHNGTKIINRKIVVQ